MSGPIAYIPVTYQVGERWRAVALVDWQYFVNTAGNDWADTEAEAHAKAEAICAKAKAERDAARQAELGELIETLPNGLEIRRTCTKLSRFDAEPTNVTLQLVDPVAEAADKPPYRGYIHNAWFNRKGEPRWRLAVVIPGDGAWKARGDIKTEAGALKALRRAGMSLKGAGHGWEAAHG